VTHPKLAPHVVARWSATTAKDEEARRGSVGWFPDGTIVKGTIAASKRKHRSTRATGRCH
jgi:hypothetical protein